MKSENDADIAGPQWAIMDESYLGAIALRMGNIDTGGGGYIGGDASARSFTGRDDGRSGYNQVEVNLNKDSSGGYQSAHPLSTMARIEELEKAVALLKQDVYGSEQSGIAGIIRRQDKQFHYTQANLIMNGLTLAALVVYILIQWAA